MLFIPIRLINDGDALDEINLNRSSTDVRANLEEIIARLQQIDLSAGNVEAVPNTLVLRDTKGTSKFSAPTNPQHPVRLGDGSSDIIGSSFVQRNSAGTAKFSEPTHDEHPLRRGDGSTEATGNTIVRRDSGGRTKFGAPTHDSHAARLLDVKEALPRGMIMMWYGSSGSVPSGWTICNGTNGTPDLRDRFVVGAGGSYSNGNRGGANSVTLSAAQMPRHRHAGSTSTSGSSHRHPINTQKEDDRGSGLYITRSHQPRGGNRVGYTEYANDAHNHSFTTDYQGSGSSHENRPPYHALFYIMKT